MKMYKDKENKEIKSEQEIRIELLEILYIINRHEFDDCELWDYINEYYEEVV